MVGILALYAVQFFDVSDSIRALVVSDIAAIAAALTLFGAVALYFWTPSNIIIASFTVYGLLTATTAALVMTSGETNSAYLAFWILLSVFASVFGFWGTGLIVGLLLGFASFIYSNGVDILSLPVLALLVLAGLVPLIVGYIIFHRRPAKADSSQSTFHQLTSELTQETNKSSTVIRAINEGVVAVNAKGIIELINPAAERIIGWGGADAVGLDYKSVLKLTDKADAPLTNANDPVVHVLSTNQDIRTKDLYVTTNGGKRLILSIVVSPIGQLGEGALIVFRDITKEQAEEREMAEFISTASHEMRTPVASIEGYLGLALNPSTAQIDEKARDFITKAHESAQHLGRLFQDLLDVSRAEDGRLSNHPNVVDIVAFIAEVTEGLRPKAEAKQLRLFFKPRTDGNDDQRTLTPVFYANVDNDHLRELVSNLIENAIKYTPSGDVIIDITGDDDHIRISVQDSGIGIPKEDIPHLFQKFYRVDNSATREIGGTGLGLYLSRRLSEVMGGRLWVESEFKKGSTFYLELPRIAREEAMHLIDAASTEIEAQPFQVESVSPILPNTPTEAVADPFIEQVPDVAPAVETTSTPPLPQPTVETPMPTSAPSQAPTLAAIEQNPTQYTQARTDASIAIPPRR